ncbi:MAG: universal stress protein [Desulfococcaceae bacterium]
MQSRLFHIFRNTPLGRETLLHSLYFCRQIQAVPEVYIPRFTKFLMYFDNDVVQVDLDGSYLTAPDTARPHLEALLSEAGFEVRLFEPKNFTASTLPDVPTHFDFMCCPRSIGDLSSKIGLGYVGPRVRRIVISAQFPVLITGSVFKPWKSVTVFFGGSANAVNALRLGLRISRLSSMPLDIFTQAEASPEAYRNLVDEAGLTKEVESRAREWRFFTEGPLDENLYEAPHDALCVAGAFGHGIIKDLVFGSTVERLHTVLTNNLLLVGPAYVALA